MSVGLYQELLDAGVEVVAFGDLFLEDVRQYREDRMRGTGLNPVFPLWKLDTRQLIKRYVGGRSAQLESFVSILRKLPASFAGRDLNQQLVDEFPSGIDPCGENGEFHTFVYDGPMFAQPIPVRSGETVTRDGFVFTDLSLPAQEARESRTYETRNARRFRGLDHSVRRSPWLGGCEITRKRTGPKMDC